MYVYAHTETAPSANPASSQVPALVPARPDCTLPESPPTAPAPAGLAHSNTSPSAAFAEVLQIPAPTSLLAELRELAASECLPPDSAHAQSDSSTDRKRKAVPGELPKPQYFEFAKRRWEKDEAFLLPDGTLWPIVQVEGISHSASSPLQAIRP